MTDSSVPVTMILTSTCLFNGEYDVAIEEYGCTECTRPTNPTNGNFR